MGILSDRLLEIIEEMKRQDEELERELYRHVETCKRLAKQIDDTLKE